MAKLPPELLPGIFAHLTDPKDVLAFRFVHRDWAIAAEPFVATQLVISFSQHHMDRARRYLDKFGKHYRTIYFDAAVPRSKPSRDFPATAFDSWYEQKIELCRSVDSEYKEACAQPSLTLASAGQLRADFKTKWQQRYPADSNMVRDFWRLADEVYDNQTSVDYCVARINEWGTVLAHCPRITSVNMPAAQDHPDPISLQSPEAVFIEPHPFWSQRAYEDDITHAAVERLLTIVTQFPVSITHLASNDFDLAVLDSKSVEWASFSRLQSLSLVITHHSSIGGLQSLLKHATQLADLSLASDSEPADCDFLDLDQVIGQANLDKVSRLSLFRFHCTQEYLEHLLVKRIPSLTSLKMSTAILFEGTWVPLLQNTAPVLTRDGIDHVVLEGTFCALAGCDFDADVVYSDGGPDFDFKDLLKVLQLRAGDNV